MGNGRKLVCLPLVDAARIVDSISDGSETHMKIQGVDGGVEEILSLNGDFKDENSELLFGNGKVHVHLDDDSCNYEDTPAGVLDIAPALEALEEKEVEDK